MCASKFFVRFGSKNRAEAGRTFFFNIQTVSRLLTEKFVICTHQLYRLFFKRKKIALNCTTGCRCNMHDRVFKKNNIKTGKKWRNFIII